MVDEATPREPRYTGPRCPSCQSPTTSHCQEYPPECPWLVCAQGRHVIRARDAKLMSDRGEYRPHERTDPRNDGLFDQRPESYWNKFYPEDTRPPATIGPSEGS